MENSHVHVGNSPEHMENFPDHVENSYVHVENSHVHVENSPVHVENSPDLSGDPFSLEKLILESEKMHQCISSLGIVKSIPKNMSPGGSKHDHVDSLAPSPKLINGFSILERFQEFISIGQAMGFGMKGCKKDYKRIIISMGGNWLATDSDLVYMLVYFPQDMPRKRQLWAYMTRIINRWHAEFNTFITNSYLIDVPLGGYSFTWSDKYASKVRLGIDVFGPHLWISTRPGLSQALLADLS
ncbi:hypothetical protein Tco_1344375 [Tanacetum coccineum]